jgi:hypothetical protein
MTLHQGDRHRPQVAEVDIRAAVGRLDRLGPRRGQRLPFQQEGSADDAIIRAPMLARAIDRVRSAAGESARLPGTPAMR